MSKSKQIPNPSEMQKVKIKMQSDRAKVKNLHFVLSF